ncbi:hypothetical protein PHMEG_00019073 [Phytophthora megakarya]|uniref:Uncharacterized protein n=1 Tax=Phytophthora megakarya TaxID=4795 RepID=A0A225VTS3_9STRA|nr:hypothetical protein PHMEG_00019073 [Phytophthora megakarya]
MTQEVLYQVRDLMADLPWNVLTGPSITEAMYFEITIDGRLGLLIERYSAVRSDPYLALFVVERKNRGSHDGARWKQLLHLFLITMREGWCDLDLLLDLFFFHFPKRTDEVAWYPGIEARRANSRILSCTVVNRQP